MGGYGSTRWGGSQVRECVESCISLAPPLGKLFPGECSFVSRSGVRVSCQLLKDGEGGYDIFITHDRGGPHSQKVRLARTRPACGGVRWWFLCPGCGLRVGRLHLPRARGAVYEFRCRRCHDLTYESAQGSRTRVRELFLMQARRWGCCSYREARDRVRRARMTAAHTSTSRLD